MSKEQIEEMAREMCHLSAECKTCQICNERYHGDDDDLCYFQCVAKEIINHGYRKQEWIAVEERLPDRVGKYLVATFDRRVGIGNLIDYYCVGELSFDSYKVTHWMPLPEPPKGGAG